MPEYSTTPLPDGIRLLAEGNIGAAIPLLGRAARMSPGSFEPHLRLADAYAAKGRKEGPAFRLMAQHEFDEAIRTVQPLQHQHDALTTFAIEAGFTERLIPEYRNRFKDLPFASDCLHALASAGTPMKISRENPLAGFLREHRLIAAGLVVGIGLLAWGLMPHARQSAPGQASWPAPDFALTDLTGASVTLSSFRVTNVVVLDFWASWCGPCRMAMPAIQSLQDKFADRGLVVLSVNLRENRDQVNEFAVANRINLHILLDSDGGVARSFGVSGIPTVVVIDKMGNVRHRHTGFSGDLEDSLAAVVEPLLNQKVSSPQ